AAGALAALRPWARRPLSRPAAVAGTLAAVAAAAAALLTGYAAGDAPAGRLAGLLLVLPNLAGGLALTSMAVPLHVRASDGGLLASVPVVGSRVRPGGHADLTLPALIGAHPAYVVLPLATAAVLLLAAAVASGAGREQPSPLATIACCAAAGVVTAAVTGAGLDLHGSGVAEPLAGSARASLPWAAVLPPAWVLAADRIGRLRSGRQLTVRRIRGLAARPKRTDAGK
ncbi:MAG: hypothetical protein ACJ74O_06025, partial [Frankiaceae bacterium]